MSAAEFEASHAQGERTMRYIRSKYGLIGRSLTVLVVMLAAIAALGVRVSAQETPTAVPLNIQTRAKFLHAGPNTGNVEIGINWDKKVDGFGYGDQSDWVDLPAGATEITMNAERHGFNYLIFDAVYPVPAGNDFYSIITDELVVNGAFDRSAVPDGGARVQVVHASVGLPAVNVVAKSSNANFATQLQYARASDYTVVPAGSYDLEVTLADGGQVALSMPGVTLNGNSVYELVVMGGVDDTEHPLTLALIEDTTEAGPAAGSAGPTPTP